MLLQSQTDEIRLLPALPSAWPTGSVKGLRARGDFEIDESWSDGKLTTATIRAPKGGTAKVRYNNSTIELTLNPGDSVRLDGTLRRQQ